MLWSIPARVAPQEAVDDLPPPPSEVTGAEVQAGTP